MMPLSQRRPLQVFRETSQKPNLFPAFQCVPLLRHLPLRLGVLGAVLSFATCRSAGWLHTGQAGRRLSVRALALGRVMAQPLPVWAPPLEKVTAGAGRMATQPALRLTSGAWVSFRGWWEWGQCHPPYRSAEKGHSVSHFLRWNAGEGVCPGQVFCVTKAFQWVK